MEFACGGFVVAVKRNTPSPTAQGSRVVYAGRRGARTGPARQLRRRLPPEAAAARRVQAGRGLPGQRAVRASRPPGSFLPFSMARASSWLCGDRSPPSHKFPISLPLPKQFASTVFDCFHLEPSNRSNSFAERGEACPWIWGRNEKKIKNITGGRAAACGLNKCCFYVREEGKHVVEEMNNGLGQTSTARKKTRQKKIGGSHLSQR
jgi:hypothetical protein